MARAIAEDQNNNFYTELLCENSTAALILCDSSETIIYCNQAFLNIFNFKKRKDVIGKTLSIIHTSGESYRSFLKKLHHAVQVRKPLIFEWELSKKDKSSFHCEINVKTVEDDKKSIAYSVLTIKDILRWKKHETELAHKTTHDLLTGFPNRILFSDRLALALIHAQRNRERLAVLFFDLDAFKDVNYKFGYNVGDLLLKETGKILTKYLRKGDTIGRFGDDEYVILLPGIIRKENAAQVAEKLLQAFHSPLSIDGYELSITASIGISIFPEDGETCEELVKNADIAMFFVKNMGRDSFKFYSAVTT
ncbi:MAG: sensor domain-containing diguanylate cyclase [Proteobacteria bacterium]|nr:sensor domain-containing diguanylate cyclase [Pseudomonadota bacterium]